MLEIKRALAQGIGRDGRARQVYFSTMTDDDVDAIVEWVRTIPPIE